MKHKNSFGSSHGRPLTIKSDQKGKKVKEDFVGVIVGRFQVPELHAGHCALIEAVRARHARVLIAIGVTQAYPSKRDPLSYALRSAMLRHAYPGAVVVPINDVGNSALWSRALDATIEATFPGARALMYGSRDSFLETYTGIHARRTLPQHGTTSGTKLRMEVARRRKYSSDFRAGVMYAQLKRAPVSYQVVDIAIIDRSGAVLLGRKEREGNLLRFVGGFVDTTDRSLEDAALRELSEEIPGTRADDLVYLGSQHIDDWRYRNTDDVVMTAFFCVTYRGGSIGPGDDLDGTKWVSREDLLGSLIPEHRALGKKLLRHMHKELPR